MQHKTLFQLSSCFLLILAGLRSYGQTQEENDLWSRFKSDIRMEQQANNGRIVWDSETSETFLQLLTNSSIETLLKYTNDSLPAVRARMFYGLCLKGASTETLQEVLRNHANDTATFTSGLGCLVSNDAVNSIMKLLFEFRRKQTLADFKAHLEREKAQPKVLIAGVRHGLIAKEDLLKAIPFMYSERGIKIVSFTLTVGEKTFQSGNTFTPEWKESIQGLESGALLFMEEIRVKGPGGKIRKLNPLTLMLW